MSILNEVKVGVNVILSAQWNVTEGQVIPTPADLLLIGGGRNLDVTILYADLAESTALVTYNRPMAARIFKSFLSACIKVIRHNKGVIRSFDGDRVMGIFIGGQKNNSAARCALQIHWIFQNVIRPKLEAKYEKIKDGTLKLDYCAGIDTGKVLAVRSGIAGSNDILWIGSSANIAAKLSALRNAPYRTYITEDVYKILNNPVKFADDGENMWEQVSNWEGRVIYGSQYMSSRGLA